MAATKYSSTLTFYNDIKMKSDVKSYEDEIEDWEDRLAEMEDSYYRKFLLRWKLRLRNCSLSRVPCQVFLAADEK